MSISDDPPPTFRESNGHWYPFKNTWEHIWPTQSKYSARNSRSWLKQSAAVLMNLGITCMYVPDTFQRKLTEAMPYCDSGRFWALAPAMRARPMAPVCTFGYTLVLYRPPGPPTANTMFSAAYASRLELYTCLLEGSFNTMASLESSLRTRAPAARFSAPSPRVRSSTALRFSRIGMSSSLAWRIRARHISRDVYGPIDVARRRGSWSVL